MNCRIENLKAQVVGQVNRLNPERCNDSEKAGAKSALPLLLHSTSQFTTRHLKIKIDEVLVRPILSMIFCEDFRQPLRQFISFDCGPFVVVAGPMITDTKSRTTYRAYFECLDCEGRGARQFLIRDGDGIKNFSCDEILFASMASPYFRYSWEISSRHGDQTWTN